MGNRNAGVTDTWQEDRRGVYSVGTYVYKIVTMSSRCEYPQCRGTVPLVLEREGLCPLHFVRKVEMQCGDIRREILRGSLSFDRRSEINEFLYAQAIILAQIATSGERLPDPTRPCLLSAFLTLINICEKVAQRPREGSAEEKLAAFPHMAVAWPAAAAK